MIWRFACLYCILAVLPPQSVLCASERRALLELRVNEVKKEEVVVYLRGDDVLARVTDLYKAGLRSFKGRRDKIRGEEYVSLKSLAPNVFFLIDDSDLSLRLTADPTFLDPTIIPLKTIRPPAIVYREDTSGFLNYAFNLRDFQRFEAFSEAGLTIKNALLYGSVSRNSEGQFVRGFSNITLSQHDRLNRAIFGDVLVNSDVLGGNLVMAGVQFARDFGLDPYFVRNPTINYSGAVTVPSTVDIYVNGRFLRQVAVPPGQFEFQDLPVPAGAGETRLVVRDAFGGEREYGTQYYFTAGLLKAGLHDFSYNLGVQRKNLGTESWDYGPFVLLGRHRFGITDQITAGFRLEASPSVVNVGSSVVMGLPLGEMELAAAASSEQGIAGGAAFLGYNYLSELFNFGLSARLLSPSYATTSLKGSDSRSWLNVNAVTGFRVRPNTGVLLRYTFDDSQSQGSMHRFSVSLSTRLMNDISLFINGAHTQQGRRSSNEVYTGLTFLLGHTTAALSYENRDGLGRETILLQKSLPLGSGYGYRLQAGTREGDDVAVDSLAQYQGAYGRYEAAYSHSAGQNLTNLRLAGGLAVIGQRFYLSRPIQQSFGVIQVPGIEKVRGYASNQEIGYSNSDGDIFVPNLLPYYGNKLGISDKDIPLNYTIDATERLVAPPLRGGSLAVFPVRRIQRVTGKVGVEKAGQRSIPSYGQLTVTAGGKIFESPIGKQGEFYLENVTPGRHAAVIDYKDQSCHFYLEVPSSEESVIELGVLRCVNQ